MLFFRLTKDRAAQGLTNPKGLCRSTATTAKPYSAQSFRRVELGAQHAGVAATLLLCRRDAFDRLLSSLAIAEKMRLPLVDEAPLAYGAAEEYLEPT